MRKITLEVNEDVFAAAERYATERGATLLEVFHTHLLEIANHNPYSKSSIYKDDPVKITIGAGSKARGTVE